MNMDNPTGIQWLLVVWWAIKDGLKTYLHDMERRMEQDADGVIESVFAPVGTRPWQFNTRVWRFSDEAAAQKGVALIEEFKQGEVWYDVQCVETYVKISTRRCSCGVLRNVWDLCIVKGPKCQILTCGDTHGANQCITCATNSGTNI